MEEYILRIQQALISHRADLGLIKGIKAIEKCKVATAALSFANKTHNPQ